MTNNMKNLILACKAANRSESQKGLARLPRLTSLFTVKVGVELYHYILRFFLAITGVDVITCPSKKWDTDKKHTRFESFSII